MKERTIAMFWLLGVFAFLLLGDWLGVGSTIVAAITGLAGVVAGYYFARDANSIPTSP